MASKKQDRNHFWMDQYLSKVNDIDDDWELDYTEKFKRRQIAYDEMLDGIATDMSMDVKVRLAAINQLAGRGRDLNGLQHEHKIQGNPNKGFTVNVKLQKEPIELIEEDEG